MPCEQVGSITDEKTGNTIEIYRISPDDLCTEEKYNEWYAEASKEDGAIDQCREEKCNNCLVGYFGIWLEPKQVADPEKDCPDSIYGRPSYRRPSCDTRRICVTQGKFKVNNYCFSVPEDAKQWDKFSASGEWDKDRYNAPVAFLYSPRLYKQWDKEDMAELDKWTSNRSEYEAAENRFKLLCWNPQVQWRIQRWGNGYDITQPGITCDGPELWNCDSDDMYWACSVVKNGDRQNYGHGSTDNTCKGSTEAAEAGIAAANSVWGSWYELENRISGSHVSFIDVVVDPSVLCYSYGYGCASYSANKQKAKATVEKPEGCPDGVIGVVANVILLKRKPNPNFNYEEGSTEPYELVEFVNRCETRRMMFGDSVDMPEVGFDGGELYINHCEKDEDIASIGRTPAYVESGWICIQASYPIVSGLND